MPRGPGERSFFFAGTCSSLSLRFSAKSAAWSWPLPPWRKSRPSPSRHLIDASSRALRRPAHGFAVKRGPAPKRKEKGPLPSGKGP